MSDKQKAIIVDLDGTISLFNHITRQGTKVENFPGAPYRKAIDASQADKDLSNPSVIEAIKMAHAFGHAIVFCSGRIDKYEQQTRTFLEEHLPGLPYQLLLRRDGDFRKDAVLKEEVYRAKIEPHYTVSFVLEDRKVCVDLWRKLGLNCWQVFEGDF